MKDKLTTLFLIIIILILIGILVFFGISVFCMFNGQETVITKIINSGYEFIDKNVKNIKIFSKDEEVNIEEEKNNLIANENDKLYYYNQLNDYSKIIYKSIDNNKENMKSGTYEIKLGDFFTDLLNQDNGYDLLGKYYQSAVETYLYENPEVFYLNPSKMYLNINKTTTSSKVTSMIGKEKVEYQVSIAPKEGSNYFVEGITSKEQVMQYEEQLKTEVDKILQKVRGKVDYEKILIIHDYLVDNITYDKTLANENIYNMYGALVNKLCVCEGYAKAYKYLLDKCGIENVIVIGEAENSKGSRESHAWNYVKLRDNWYAVDVTWDDPIIIGNGKIDGKIKYRYFLLGKKDISKDHFVSNTFTDNGQEYTQPVLSERNYN